MDQESDTVARNDWAYFFASGQGVLEGVLRGMPWSGNERNHLYFGGIPGAYFEDYSGISGIDDPGDGRSFSLLDYDRDGRLDLALASPGRPRFRLLRNNIGDRVGANNAYIALRFVGGNHTAQPSSEWSARDGFGTAVHVNIGGITVFREHQPEGGYVGQHSNTMIVGIGPRDRASKIEVRWLSGKTQSLADIPARKLVTVYEDLTKSPTGQAFVVKDYERDTASLGSKLASNDFLKTRFLPTAPLASELTLEHEGKRLGSETGLTLVATMATWCVACVGEMPEFNALRAAFTPEELAIYAVPVDAKDTQSMLTAWAARYKPPYEIMAGIDRTQVDKVKSVTMAELRTEAVPATFVTNAEGQVLIARWGVPTVSDVRRLLWEGRANRAGTLVAATD